MKVLINKSRWFFDLSFDAVEKYYKKKRRDIFFYTLTSRKQIENEYIENYSLISAEEARDNGYEFALFENVGENINSMNNNISKDIIAPTRGFQFYNLRNDIDLIEAVEKLGEAANTEHSVLKIIEIPDDTMYEIIEIGRQNGESIHEIHRSWE